MNDLCQSRAFGGTPSTEEPDSPQVSDFYKNAFVPSPMTRVPSTGVTGLEAESELAFGPTVVGPLIESGAGVGAVGCATSETLASRAFGEVTFVVLNCLSVLFASLAQYVLGSGGVDGLDLFEPEPEGDDLVGLQAALLGSMLVGVGVAGLLITPVRAPGSEETNALETVRLLTTYVSQLYRTAVGSGQAKSAVPLPRIVGEVHGSNVPVHSFSIGYRLGVEGGL